MGPWAEVPTETTRVDLPAPLELFLVAVKWQRADPSRLGLPTGLYVRGSLGNYVCLRCVGMNSKSSLAFSNRAMAYLKVSEQDGTHRTVRRNRGVAHRISCLCGHDPACSLASLYADICSYVLILRITLLIQIPPFAIYCRTPVDMVVPFAIDVLTEDVHTRLCSL